MAAGDRFVVLHMGEAVNHPLTKKKLGYMVLVSGEVTVLEGTSDLITARINKSYRSIYIGDQIIPPSAQIAETIPLHISPNKIEGVVVSPVEEEENITEKELVFIDRGSQDGVLVGDLFGIYQSGVRSRANDYGQGASKTGGESLSFVKIGEAVVVSVQEETSTALVTHSYQSIYVGDRVVSGKK